MRNFAPRHYSQQQNFKKSSKKKTKTPYQKFLLQSVIQCLTCGGTMKKEKIGYDCINCDNFLTSKEIFAYFHTSKTIQPTKLLKTKNIIK